MISRSTFLRLFTAMIASGVVTSAYGVVLEPFYRLRVTRYKLTPPNWPKGLKLRLALLADIHACIPWMDAARVGRIAAMTNELNADAVLLLGDFIASHHFKVHEDLDAWAGALKTLKAPNGVHAILGNHDWWNDEAAMRRGAGPVAAQVALEKAGIPVYENSAVRLQKDGKPFWIAGLGDQIAFVPVRGWRNPPQGIDDLPATLSKITDEAPVILMAHEPDIFPDVPDRVALTLSGHTHGGQLNIFGFRPIVPSRFGRRYAYGHIVERNRNLIVSGGLGCSVVPARIGSPPEIVVVDLGE